MSSSALAFSVLQPTEEARPDRSALTAEIVDHAWMQAARCEWERLALEALSPNPFYAPLVLEAHLAHGLLKAAPRFAIVRRGSRLVGLLPLSAGTVRFGWTGRAASAVHSPYMVSSTPLLAPDAAEEICAALLDALAAASGGLWRLPLFRFDDAVGEAFRAALSRRGWAWRAAEPFARAVLDRRPLHDEFTAALGSRRRKDVGRRRRRLSEMGSLTLRTDASGPGLAQAMEEFLALEAQGWKGARGTALASRPNTAAYARALIAEASPAVEVRVDRLMLDGRAIAASVALVGGGTAYLYKTAYDETLARFAPGVLLEHEIVRSLHETAFASRLNSASLAGSLLDTIFPDREQVGDLVFSTDPALGETGLDTLLARDAARRAVLHRAKAFYRRFRPHA